MLSSPNAREIREAIRAMLSIPSLPEVLVLGTQLITAEILTRGTVGNWPAEPVVRGPGETVSLESLDVAIKMNALYGDSGVP